MMKKVLALILVLGMTSLANATVIDVVIVGEGSMGHAGTSEDPLWESETVDIAIVLRNLPGSHATASYEGYMLSMMDLDLHVSGPGTLSELGDLKATKLAHHASFSPWAEPEPAIVDNSIAYLSGTVADPGIQAMPGDVDLVWNLVIHCDGEGFVNVDLTLNGLTQYGDFYGDTWKDLTESDLGDLVIHQIPEPMTIALLGLGGLFLRRRR